MKLVYVDNKKARRIIAESDNVTELTEAMMKDQASRFCFPSGKIALPDALERGKNYVLSESNGNSYILEN